MPEVGIFPAQQSNAFATGWNRNKTLVAVSEGLLQRLNKDEIRAVLAHEVGHRANGDMVTLALIQGVVNTFVIFFARIVGHTVDRVVFKTERGHGIGYYVVTFMTEIVLAILASTIVAWFSASASSAPTTPVPPSPTAGAMIAALQRLKAESEALAPNQMPDTLVAFGISAGVKEGILAAFATHPPLEERT